MDLVRKNLLTLSREELVQKAKALRELQERDKREAAKFYIPNGKAEQFINLVGSDKCFVNMFVGANGTSKTATGANIVANIVFGQQSPWFKGEAFDWEDSKGTKNKREAVELPLFENFPYIKRGRIISDPTTIKEKIVPELIKWFPRNSYQHLPEATYKTSKDGKFYASKFKTNTGWEIDVMSNEQDVGAFESVDLGFVWIDEPMPKDKFLATIARGRMGMTMFWTYTPLFYSGWIKDWMDDHLGGDYADYVEAEMEDNCITHGIRGFFKHKDIQRIADGLPEDEKEARVFGKFGHLIGRVHKRFSRKIHVIKPFPLNERDWTTYKALDPHPRVEDHVLYLSVNRKGTKIITGELLSEGLVKLLYERMKALETKMNFRIEDRIIDPSAYVDDQHRTEKSVGSQLFDLGEHYIKGSKDLMAGIKRTDTALDFEIKGGKFFREPELFIFDSNPVTIKQIEEYVWDEHRGRSADDRQKSGRPKDKNDHQPENLHRLLLHEPAYIPYQYRQDGFVPTGSGMSEISDHNFDPYDE